VNGLCKDCQSLGISCDYRNQKELDAIDVGIHDESFSIPNVVDGFSEQLWVLRDRSEDMIKGEHQQTTK